MLRTPTSFGFGNLAQYECVWIQEDLGSWALRKGKRCEECAETNCEEKMALSTIKDPTDPDEELDWTEFGTGCEWDTAKRVCVSQSNTPSVVDCENALAASEKLLMADKLLYINKESVKIAFMQSICNGKMCSSADSCQCLWINPNDGIVVPPSYSYYETHMGGYRFETQLETDSGCHYPAFVDVVTEQKRIIDSIIDSRT